MAGATASTFSIASAQPTNAGSYSVEVANYYGSTNSQPATLAVVNPFTISGQVFDPTGT